MSGYNAGYNNELFLGCILYAYLCGLILFLFFQKVAFWRPIFGKKLGKKFGRKKMRGGDVWGGEGGGSMKQDTMSYLS